MKTVFAFAMSFLLASVSVAQDSEIPAAETPVAEHALLQKDVGTWKGTMKMLSDDPKTAVSFPVREINRSFGNGLWIMTEFDAGPMKGHGSFGYDIHNKKFVGTWIENMHSTLSIAEGQYDKEKGELVMLFSGTDPASGKPNQMKAVSSYDGEDKRHFVMYAKNDSEWVPAFTIDYERVKE